MSLIQWDKDLLVSLNAKNSDFWDGFMWMATDEISWLVFFAAILYAIYKYKGKEFFLIIVALALTVVICDQVSGFFKDWVARPRPSREADIMQDLHIVNGYRGGKYGFFSSHAANTFGIAVLVMLIVRNWVISSVMLLWALLESYSRIYLGVHYPLDIITGMSFGAITGFGVYKLHSFLAKRFSFISYADSASLPIGGVVLAFVATLFMMMVGSEAIMDFLL